MASASRILKAKSYFPQFLSSHTTSLANIFITMWRNGIVETLASMQLEAYSMLWTSPQVLWTPPTQTQLQHCSPSGSSQPPTTLLFLKQSSSISKLATNMVFFLPSILMLRMLIISMLLVINIIPTQRLRTPLLILLLPWRYLSPCQLNQLL
jgi:hypothetical protein